MNAGEAMKMLQYRYGKKDLEEKGKDWVEKKCPCPSIGPPAAKEEGVGE